MQTQNYNNKLKSANPIFILSDHLLFDLLFYPLIDVLFRVLLPYSKTGVICTLICHSNPLFMRVTALKIVLSLFLYFTTNILTI
jgi:hypothetical protein